LADTTHLTTEEHGAYLLLLMAMWRRGGTVPDNNRDLARMLKVNARRWPAIKARLMPFLKVLPNGELTQGRLEKEFRYGISILETNQQNGSLGGRPPASKNKDLDKADGSVSVKRTETPHNQNHNQNQESPKDDPGADAPNVIEFPSSDRPKYAFEAGVIKIAQQQLDAWQRAFPSISVEAELWSLADWAARQSDWFFAVSGALAKKNRAAFERIKAAETAEDGEPEGQTWWERDPKLTPEQKRSFRSGRSF
jgi:uncharacterized protein YdaU (DUF1376 family)